jgi:hypothetical protein
MVRRLAKAALTADETAQLNHLCDLERSGNAAQIRVAEKQICLRVIKDSAPGLAAPAVQAAQQSCNKPTPAG